MNTLLTYAQRRAITKAAPGSAGAQLRQMTEDALDVGEFESFSRAWNAIRMRNPLLYRRYIAETGENDDAHEDDGDDAEEETVNADQELLAKATALVEQGSAATLTEAIGQVVKSNAALWKSREVFWHSAGAVPPGGAPPRRQPLPSHGEELAPGPDTRQVAPVSPTDAHASITRLVDEERERHPGMSDHDLMKLVTMSPRGQQLMREHRSQHFARTRG
jgi:hypothetical protein